MRTIKPHGYRTRYIHHGCRCAPCKEANRTYIQARRLLSPHPNALVSARVARRHLKKLSRAGVGVRSVRDVTGISFTRLRELKSSNPGRVKRTTERLILNVTTEAHADYALIPGNKTARLVTRLMIEGFSYEQLALKLDVWPETLSMLVKRKGNVRAITQMKVEKFYNRLMAEAAA